MSQRKWTLGNKGEVSHGIDDSAGYVHPKHMSIPLCGTLSSVVYTAILTAAPALYTSIILPYLKEVWCLLYQVFNTVHSILGFGCLRYPKIRRFPSYPYEDKPSTTLWNLLEGNLGSGDVLEYVDDQELSIDVVCGFWS